MEYYVVDVKSTRNVDGKDVAFDYCNIYYNEYKANEEARWLAYMDEDVLEVGVYRWILKSNGAEEIDWDYIGFHHLNRNHREMKED